MDRQLNAISEAARRILTAGETLAGKSSAQDLDRVQTQLIDQLERLSQQVFTVSDLDRLHTLKKRIVTPEMVEALRGNELIMLNAVRLSARSEWLTMLTQHLQEGFLLSEQELAEAIEDTTNVPNTTGMPTRSAKTPHKRTRKTRGWPS